jgi:hypothetical protein
LKEVFQKKKGSAFEFFFFYVWGWFKRSSVGWNYFLPIFMGTIFWVIQNNLD